MWYEDNARKTTLDYSKPIVAEMGSGTIILLPTLGQRYQVKGYNWFRLSDGGWNSTLTWPTPEAAVKAYSNYNPHNAVITTKEV